MLDRWMDGLIKDRKKKKKAWWAQMQLAKSSSSNSCTVYFALMFLELVQFDQFSSSRPNNSQHPLIDEISKIQKFRQTYLEVLKLWKVRSGLEYRGSRVAAVNSFFFRCALSENFFCTMYERNEVGSRSCYSFFLSLFPLFDPIGAVRVHFRR